MRQEPRPALLLLGPTGSGKTPLGTALAEMGLHGDRLIHFDFGAQLRLAAQDPGAFPLLGTKELQTIRRVLSAGTLLTDAEFPVADAILESFLAHQPQDDTAAVVMNGLPRHAGQARAAARLVHITAVVVLECTPATAAARIKINSGGDRSGRSDDSPEAVRDKLRRFHDRTRPLAGYYRDRGAAVISVEIGLFTGPQEIIAVLETQLPPGFG